MSLVVKNALVVTPSGVVHGGVACEEGAIVQVGGDRALPSSGDVIDAGGKWLIPGVIDPHTHIGVGPADATVDRLRSSWESETRGAAHKGITTVISFQGGSPIPMRDPHVPWVERQIEEAEEVAYADFALHAIMQTDGHLWEQEELAGLGVVGFKHFYTAYKPDADATAGQISIGYTDDGMLYESFQNLGRLRAEGVNVLGMIHAEDADICKRLEAQLQAAGRNDLAAWGRGPA